VNHTIVIVIAVVAVLGLLSLLMSARRKARQARTAAREAIHTVSVTGRVLLAAGVITGVQFAVIRFSQNNVALLLGVLAVPALLAAVPLVRALTLTSVGTTTRKGARR
jgi:predicted RND superfamily exporter protein